MLTASLWSFAGRGTASGTAAEAHQNALPQQQQDLLHGEVRGVSAAELGDHAEEHDGNGLIVEKRRTYRGRGSERVETGESGAAVEITP